MLSAPRYVSIRGIERLVAAFLLAGAVVGVALIPRLLGPGGETPLHLSAPAGGAATVVHAAPVPPLLHFAPAPDALAELAPAPLVVPRFTASPAGPAFGAAATRPNARRTTPGSSSLGPRTLRPGPSLGPPPTIAPEPTPVTAPAPAPTVPVAAPAAPAPAAPAQSASRQAPPERHSPSPAQPPAEPTPAPTPTPPSQLDAWTPGFHHGPSPIPLGGDPQQNLRDVLSSSGGGSYQQPAQLQQQSSPTTTQSSATTQTTTASQTTTTSQSDPAPSTSSMQPVQISVALSPTG